MTAHTIYGIRERGSKEVRYVGQTRTPLDFRLHSHKGQARGVAHQHPAFSEWLESANPEIFAIARCDTRQEAEGVEKVIIAMCLRLGHRLFNRRHVLDNIVERRLGKIAA